MVQVQLVLEFRLDLPPNQIVTRVDMPMLRHYCFRSSFLIDIHTFVERSEVQLAVLNLLSFLNRFVDCFDHFLLIMAETEFHYLFEHWLLTQLLCKIGR